MKGPHVPGSEQKKLFQVGLLDRRKKLDKLRRAGLRLQKELPLAAAGAFVLLGWNEPVSLGKK